MKKKKVRRMGNCNKQRCLIKDIEDPVLQTVSLVKEPCVRDAYFTSIKKKEDDNMDNTDLMNELGRDGQGYKLRKNDKEIKRDAQGYRLPDEPEEIERDANGYVLHPKKPTNVGVVFIQEKKGDQK